MAVSSFTDAQLLKTIETMRQKCMTPERWQRILSSGIFADLCDPEARFDQRNSVRRALGLEFLVPDRFKLCTEGRTFDQLIAAGGYSWVQGEIKEKFFPIACDNTKFEGALFRVPRIESYATPETMISLMQEEATSRPWRPAKLEHLLAFGEQFPDEQRKLHIAALGSITLIRRRDRMPALSHRTNGDRTLELVPLGVFGTSWRFLSVRGELS